MRRGWVGSPPRFDLRACCYDSLRDEEAETGPLRLVGITLPEALEYVWNALGGDAGPGIGDDEMDHVASPVDRDRYLTAWGRELESVPRRFESTSKMRSRSARTVSLGSFTDGTRRICFEAEMSTNISKVWRSRSSTSHAAGVTEKWPASMVATSSMLLTRYSIRSVTFSIEAAVASHLVRIVPPAYESSFERDRAERIAIVRHDRHQLVPRGYRLGRGLQGLRFLATGAYEQPGEKCRDDEPDQKQHGQQTIHPEREPSSVPVRLSVDLPDGGFFVTDEAVERSAQLSSEWNQLVETSNQIVDVLRWLPALN